MEEVWKDITLTTLHNEIPPTPPLSLHHHLPRDFLAGGATYKEGPPPPCMPPQHLPPIDLNLDSSYHLDHNVHIITPRKRSSVAEQQHLSDGGGFHNDGDSRRHKRMIKNRESAARSRARKQAYTNELELEVAHLVQENSKLRRQCEELSVAMAAQIPAKKTLQRASSASF